MFSNTLSVEERWSMNTTNAAEGQVDLHREDTHPRTKTHTDFNPSPNNISLSFAFPKTFPSHLIQSSELHLPLLLHFLHFSNQQTYILTFHPHVDGWVFGVKCIYLSKENIPAVITEAGCTVVLVGRSTWCAVQLYICETIFVLADVTCTTESWSHALLLFASIPLAFNALCHFSQEGFFHQSFWKDGTFSWGFLFIS